MDKTDINSLELVYSERFRTPGKEEKLLGLWIDRIGSGLYRQRPEKLRMLGLYGALLIESGEGALLTPATGELTLKAGDTALLFPGEPSMYYPKPKEMWKVRWMLWQGNDAEMMENLGYLQSDRPVVKGCMDTFTSIFGQMEKLILTETPEAILKRKKLIMELVLELYQASKLTARSSGSHKLINQALKLIDQKLTGEISIHGLAKKFNLSEAHFRRLFMQKTGRNPKEYILSRRISRAKELLNQGKPIKEVASLLGFQDQFYFMRLFRKVAGCSPGKFQKINR
jgi:AraC family transcriptional regulator of arabinose operon